MSIAPLISIPSLIPPLRSPRPAFCALGGALVALALCAWPLSAGAQNQPITEQEARAQLQNDLDTLQGQIMRRHDDQLAIALQNAESDTSRDRLNQWTRSMKDQYRSAFRGADPRESLIKIWTLSAQVEEFLSEPGEDEPSLFGSAHTDMQEMAGAILTMIEDLARTYLPASAFESARTHIRNHVNQTPLRTGLDRAGLLTVLDDTWSGVLSVGGGALRRVTDIPLMPTRSLGAEGFGLMSDSIDQFRASMEQMPDELRRQIERLLTELADQQTSLSLLLADVLTTLEQVDTILEGSEVLTRNVEQTLKTSELPLTLTRDITQSAEKVAVESRLLVESLSALMEQIEANGDASTTPTARPFDVREYTSAALALNQGAQSVNDVLIVIQELIQAGEEGEPSDHPFDIREYEAAARAIEDASAAINLSVADARAILESGDLAENAEPIALMVDDSLASGAERLAGLVDHIAWRLAQIIALIFALAVAWVFLRALASRQRPTSEKR